MPQRRLFLNWSEGIVAGFGAIAVVAGGTLIALGLREPASKPIWAEAVPVAVARSVPDRSAAPDRGTAASKKSFVDGVRLASYDARSGTALLATRGGQATTVRSGDVIASPPSEAAPKGALFAVGAVTPVSDGIKVTTKPATLRDALGAAQVKRTFEAKDIEMSVTPLAAGVTPAAKAPELPGAATGGGSNPSSPTSAPTSATPSGEPSRSTPASAGTKRTIASAFTNSAAQLRTTPASEEAPSPAESEAPSPAGSKAPSPADSATSSAGDAPIPGIAIGGDTIVEPTRTADGGLLLSLDIPLNGVPGITGTSKGAPKLAGWVGLTPKLVFSFGHRDIDGERPFQAEIGVGGGYTYGWQVHAALAGLADTGDRSLRLPFAEVHLNETFWVGPVPIVISADLTYFYRLTAAGNLTIDSEQTTTGEFAVGGAYDSRKGWGPLNRNAAETTGDAVPTVTGSGDMRAIIGADLSVFLYGSAGVTGRLAPYVRAAVNAGFAPIRWGVYAGFDLTATLTLKLEIFGVTIFKADQPVPPIHAEWKVAASDPEPPVAASTS